MLPSMWTSYLIEQYPEEMAVTLADHGWTRAEISDEHGHDLLKRGDPTAAGEAFRRFAMDHGLSFPQGHFYLCNKGFRPEDRESRGPADIAPADPKAFEQAMADMRRWIDLFAALGVKAGVLHLGGRELAAAGWSEEAIFERRCEALTRVADYAKGTGVLICLENLGRGSGVCTMDDFERLLEAVNLSNVAICLDTGHAHMNGIDNADFIRRAGSRLRALHIADNLGNGDHHMLPYGRGTVAWTPVMTALREVGYSGLFNFEVPGENSCPLPVRLAKLDYALNLARWMIERDGR